MVEGRLVDPSSGSDRTVLSLPFTYAWAQRTADGLLFQGPAGAADDRERMWAFAEGQAGEARTVSSGSVGTMALNADATKAAHVSFDARDPDRPADDLATVVLTTFPGLRELRRARLPRPEARVSGFVGEHVLLTSGLGSDVVVLLWDPAGSIQQLDRWRVVEVTEPRTSRAVLRDFTPCARLFSVGRDVEEPYSTPCLFYPAFSRDGRTYAAFESFDGTPRGILRVRDLATGSVVGTQTFDGIEPLLWGPLTILTRDRVLVTVQDRADNNGVRYAVLRCVISEDRCEVAWRSDAVLEARQVSVVAP